LWGNFHPNVVMKRNSFCCAMVACFAVSWFVLSGGVLSASADVFTIDPAQSSLAVSGSAIGIALAPQGSGSLTTTYSGTIQLTQTAGTIQFTGGSLIAARTNGSWQPLAGGGAGSAPADYGGVASSFITANVALRSILLDVTSPPITVTSGQFDPSNLTFLFPVSATSAIDYRYTGLSSGSGSKVATGNATNNVAALATITTVGSAQTLTIGVNAKFTFTLVTSGDTIVNVAGQIVATNNSVSAPVVLQTPTVTNQVVTLAWTSPAGQLFQVLSSSNLLMWQTNASNVTSVSTNYTWTTTNTDPKGYYRLAH
jgi:hypothetical protein